VVGVVVDDIDVAATVAIVETILFALLVVTILLVVVMEVLAEGEAAFVVLSVPVDGMNVISLAVAVLFASIFVVLSDILDISVGEFALSADGVEELKPVDEKDDVKNSSVGANLLVAESNETVNFCY
jgi:hypothetical protein